MNYHREIARKRRGTFAIHLKRVWRGVGVQAVRVLSGAWRLIRKEGGGRRRKENKVPGEGILAVGIPLWDKGKRGGGFLEGPQKGGHSPMANMEKKKMTVISASTRKELHSVSLANSQKEGEKGKGEGGLIITPAEIGGGILPLTPGGYHREGKGNEKKGKRTLYF